MITSLSQVVAVEALGKTAPVHLTVVEVEPVVFLMVHRLQSHQLNRCQSLLAAAEQVLFSLLKEPTAQTEQWVLIRH